MKTNLLRVFLCSMSFLTLQSNAQNWELVGNANATPDSKLGTTNAVPLSLYTNNIPRMTITSTGRIGIGTVTPVNLFTLKSGNTTNPSAAWISTGSPIITTYSEGIVGNSDIISSMASDAAAVSRPIIMGRRSRGTLSTPTAVIKGDYLLSLLASGFDGTNFHHPAGIDFLVEANATTNNVPAYISMHTGKIERFRITHHGNIYFNNNVLTMNNSNGDINIGKGKLFFSKASQTIQFSDVSGTVAPMVTMFTTANPNTHRMVLAPSLTNPNYGLKYTQTNDSTSTWDFVGSRGSVLKIEPIKKKVTIGDSLIASRIVTDSLVTKRVITDSFFTKGFFTERLKVLGAHEVGTIESFNYGDGDGLFGYAVGTGGWLSAGVSGQADGIGAGVHGESIEGAGVDGYSVGGIGMGGSSGDHYGVYGYTENSTSFAGYFDGDVFAERYLTSSDRKLKKDITEMTAGMDIIKKLKPKTYEYRQDGNYRLMNLPQGKKFGLIAQDLEEVLPNIVKQSSFDPKLTMPRSRSRFNSSATATEKIDFKAVNYTELIPIMIKGMQEQSAVIEEQKAAIESKDKEIQDIKLQFEQLKNLLIAKGLIQDKEISTTAVNISNEAQLDQNIPNPPLNGTTRINYNIPATAGKSEIIFNDITGRKVKQVALTNKGKGVLNVETAGMTTGTYTYSLIVDGKLIKTKKLVIASK